LATNLLHDPQTVNQQPLPHACPVQTAHKRAISVSKRQVERSPITRFDIWRVGAPDPLANREKDRVEVSLFGYVVVNRHFRLIRAIRDPIALQACAA